MKSAIMRHTTEPCRRARAFARSFLADSRGVSILELALSLPLLLTLGLYGTEMAYMATVNTQVGAIANSVADNASRLGQTDNSAVTPTVTETEINSVMSGALVQGNAFDFEKQGRIILSSLEKDSATGKQYIHWQRCKGDYDHASRYGPEGTGLDDGTTLAGMGEAGHLITANSNSAVMFVEVYFHYQPLFGTVFVGDTTFSREAAFIIRDDRNLTPGVTGTANQSACS
ncbi:pilus assembly protein TadE [Novosphingobium mangrovi (ex Huang et al. 2023)]|uniref:Pilus assembly protein TadE n=1 Tax=Novosphingobium mangrovi (ex Huang et al. 2023) TaxID=2976432 RepID=A0ABT2I6M4_9SPHN|nr:pilus assembly protein TadE [Novosphingobium mangrovi (ex Huang et al. 2023)]MCT2400455.1 pilus assembly protein TadE [Novosphingobium mangrovi (ex Huang et al. 2023)]